MEFTAPWGSAGGSTTVGCRNDARMGDPGRLWLDGSEASVRRRAVRREPTETNTFEVNENKHGCSGVLPPSAGRCAGERWTHVSAERNATICWLNIVSPSHPQACGTGRTAATLKNKTHEKTSVFRGSAEIFAGLRPARLGDTGLEPVTPTMSR